MSSYYLETTETMSGVKAILTALKELAGPDGFDEIEVSAYGQTSTVKITARKRIKKEKSEREIVALQANRGVHLDENGQVAMWENQAMAFKIETNDIHDKIDRRLWEPYINAHGVAKILRAAIEAGLVSPPVYTVRDNQGNLLDDEVYGLWANPDAAESQHKEDYTAEHWKGQTE